MPSFDAAWRYEEIMEEAVFFAMDELGFLVAAQVEELQKQRFELEERQRVAEMASKQAQLSLSYLQHPPSTPAALLMESNPGMDPASTVASARTVGNNLTANFQNESNPDGQNNAITPHGSNHNTGRVGDGGVSLSPNLNFALDMDF